MGTPAFQSTAQTTTSKAMGMGSNVPNAATMRMTVAFAKRPSTCAISATRVQGKSSTRAAPKSPARIMRGSEMRMTVSRFFAYRINTQGTAWNTVLGASPAGVSSDCDRRANPDWNHWKTRRPGTRAGSSTGLRHPGRSALRDRYGTTTSTITSAVATLSAAKYQGKSVSSIPSTITLKLGDANMAASATSTRLPPLSIAWPMGAAQLTQTPSGAPTSIPCTAPASLPPRGRGRSGINVNRPAASSRPNVIPCLLVTPHSAATQRMRLNFSSARGSGKWPSNPSGVESASSGSAPALLCRDG